MADTITLNAGTGGSVLATDAIGSSPEVHYQIVKPAFGALDTATLVTSSAGLPVAAQGTFPVTDNGGSLTVDNGGTFAVQADTELTTADLDTGAGTDTRAVVGLALAASGGALLVGSANPMPISDNSGSITVDGTVAISGTVAVTDNSGSLTVDNNGTFAVQAATAGDVAHDGVDSGNPVKIGGKSSTTLPSVVSASGDRVNAYFDTYGMQFVRTAAQAQDNKWTAIHAPSSNTQATATKASAGAGVKNVLTDIIVTFAATGTAPTATNLTVNVIDGASGGGTYLLRAAMAIPATAGAMNGFTLTNLWLPGTAATALTVEFSAAGGANTVECVSFSGVTVAA